MVRPLLCALVVFVLVVAAYLFPRLPSHRAASVSGRAVLGPPRFMTREGRPSKLSFEDMLRDDFEFDMRGSDVMVFLHIQKTGGTVFGRHLVRDLELERPCQCLRGRKRCRCARPPSAGGQRSWLFSRYSTGWKCGLHADWTELTACVDHAMDRAERAPAKRRYFYVTLLREPVARFLSEFRHVQRGATWRSSRHLCGGRAPTADELPFCFNGTDWRDVTFQEFLACPSNLAVNRQTRMLADLTLVGCYNRSSMSEHERDLLLLASARKNLRSTAFFGLTEEQHLSQQLFEATFGLRFVRPFEQLNETRSTAAQGRVPPDDLKAVRRSSRSDAMMVETKLASKLWEAFSLKGLNHLDVQLYDYARKLMSERLQRLKERGPVSGRDVIHGRLSCTSSASLARNAVVRSGDGDAWNLRNCLQSGALSSAGRNWKTCWR
ncbi:heparan sulfate 6-O-sulfotransferase isoform X5 [Rhipicephalus microplus]|uniref:heparan sulfate 6-O-sulfotransferase isoform X5 n=1 Tax=Rhipicephalus microplus TaxID=6941 RepID=UPI003F6BA165